jgi:hypothetical protein
MSLDVHLLHKCEQMCKRKHNELLRLIRQTDKVLTPTLTLCLMHPRNIEPQYYLQVCWSGNSSRPIVAMLFAQWKRDQFQPKPSARCLQTGAIHNHHLGSKFVHRCEVSNFMVLLEVFTQVQSFSNFHKTAMVKNCKTWL